MSEVPKDVVSATDLAEWYRLKKELGRIKSAEALLRSRIFRFYFDAPTEGTNTHPLNDGTGAELKAVHSFNRNIDPGALDAYRSQMGSKGSNLPKLPLDDLVKWKPELAISEYRKLTAEEQHAFDQCLIVKEGSPQLDIVIPKKVKG